jgi:lysophospholipase L1-like esterase
MRDDEPAPRGANVRRIAVVGDSTTFGFAVEARETYADVLEELLNADVTDGRRFETLNFGVGGYSTRDEVLVVEHKALAFDPELIVIGYSLNDADPRPIQPLHQHFVRPEWWQHSNLLRLAARWSHAGELQPDGGKGYTQSIYAADSPTWASVVDGFARIAELSRPRDIPVLVVIFPRLNELGEPPYPLRAIHAQVSQAARAAGLLVLDLERAYARLPVESLRNPRDAMHPSVLGHRLAAEAIRARVGPRLERLGATSRDDANAEH